MYRIATAQLWVHDQDEALAFYTRTLGWEVRADVTLPEMGDFRWLTVGPAGQEEVSIVLMLVPGPPVMDDGTAGQVAAGASTSADLPTVTVKIYAGANTSGTLLQTVTPSVSGGGAWTFDAAALPEGTYTAQATQADNTTPPNTGTSAARTCA